MNEVVHTFRVSLLRLSLAAAFFQCLFSALVILFILLAGRRVIWLYLALFAILPLLYWIFYGLRFRLIVSREGFNWTTLEGETLFARWDEIEGASRDRFPFLAAIGIELGNGRGRSFVLLVLSNPEEFRDALREYAGADHPLTRAVNGTLG